MTRLTDARVILLLLASVLGLCALSLAAVPPYINYQGKLTDSAGNPLEDKTHSITFSIYEVESGGTPIWQETQPVATQKGIFSVLLGSVTNLNIAFDKPYFLEIKVGDEVMSPRQRMSSAGYAMRAKDVDSLPRGVIVMWSGKIAEIPAGWRLCDGTNGTPDLRDRFIAGAGNIYSIGATGGEAMHTLTIAEMPAHTHTLSARLDTTEGHWDYGRWQNDPPGATLTTGSTGGGDPHENRPPYYAMAYIMKL